MTQEQRNLIRQAIGALKAALDAAPELPFEDLTKKPPPPSRENMWKMNAAYKELAEKLYAIYGTRRINYNDTSIRRMAFDMGITRFERYIISLEERQIVEVERKDVGQRTRFVSFRFIKSMTA